MRAGKRETIRLKPGRERSLLNRHPWIFSGAIERFPDLPNGSTAPIEDSSGATIAVGYFNRECSLAVRVLAFHDSDAQEALRERIRAAIALRTKLGNSQTTGVRLINGEADGIPGCIVDKYADVLVLQSGTLGIDQLQATLVDELQRCLSPRGIYEKSTLPSRAEEKLQSSEGILTGEVPENVTFHENGLQFTAQIRTGQKTGFFLDQREMRSLVREYSNNRTVLNCFSYSGAFSVYAYAGGARSVTSIDSSAAAINLAHDNLARNGFSADPATLRCADVFDELRSVAGRYDFIILDPPAFAKRRASVDQAVRGYGEINRVAIEQLPPGGLLLTCSCSYHVDEALFQKTIFHAARDAKRSVRILQRHRLAWDHPISVFHPEGEYLKSLFMIVE